jgi:hypothetical protein
LFASFSTVRTDRGRAWPLAGLTSLGEDARYFLMRLYAAGDGGGVH